MVHAGHHSLVRQICAAHGRTTGQTFSTGGTRKLLTEPPRLFLSFCSGCCVCRQRASRTAPRLPSRCTAQQASVAPSRPIAATPWPHFPRSSSQLSYPDSNGFSLFLHCINENFGTSYHPTSPDLTLRKTVA